MDEQDTDGQEQQRQFYARTLPQELNTPRLNRLGFERALFGHFTHEQEKADAE